MRKVIALALATVIGSAFAVTDVTGTATRNVFRDSFMNNIGSVAGEFGYVGIKNPILGFNVGALANANLSSKAFEIGYAMPMGANALFFNIGMTDNGSMNNQNISNGLNMGDAYTNGTGAQTTNRVYRNMNDPQIGNWTIDSFYKLAAGYATANFGLSYNGDWRNRSIRTESSNQTGYTNLNNTNILFESFTEVSNFALDRRNAYMNHGIVVNLSLGEKMQLDAKLNINNFNGSFDQYGVTLTETYQASPAYARVRNNLTSAVTINGGFAAATGIASLRGTEINIAADLYLDKNTENTLFVTPSYSVYLYANDANVFQTINSNVDFATNGGKELTNVISTNTRFHVASRMKGSVGIDYKKIWGKDSVVEFGLNPNLTVSLDGSTLQSAETNVTYNKRLSNDTANTLTDEYHTITGTGVQTTTTTDFRVTAKISPAVRIKVLPKVRLIAGTSFQWDASLNVAENTATTGYAGTNFFNQGSTTAALPYYRLIGKLNNSSTTTDVTQMRSLDTTKTVTSTWSLLTTAATLDTGLEFKPDDHLTIGLLAQTGLNGFSFGDVLGLNNGVGNTRLSVQAVYAF